MADIIDFQLARSRLRPDAAQGIARRNFLIVEIPEETMQKIEKARMPVSAHLDLIIY